MNKVIMKAAGFGEQVKLVEEHKCPCCEARIGDHSFRDELSRREYRISGMCQKCQDEVFSPVE